MIVSPHIKQEYIKPICEQPKHLGNPFNFPLNLDESGISAIEEMKLICDFLYFNSNSKPTLVNYTKELEKFSQWLWRIKRTPLLEITRFEAQQYIDFIQSPPYHWISRKGNHAKYINNTENPLWRPFAARKGNDFRQTKQSNRSAISCLRVFYNHLIKTDKTNTNPFALIKSPECKVDHD